MGFRSFVRSFFLERWGFGYGVGYPSRVESSRAELRQQQAARNNYVRGVIYLITIALLCLRLQSLYGTLE